MVSRENTGTSVLLIKGVCVDAVAWDVWKPMHQQQVLYAPYVNWNPNTRRPRKLFRLKIQSRPTSFVWRTMGIVSAKKLLSLLPKHWERRWRISPVFRVQRPTFFSVELHKADKLLP